MTSFDQEVSAACVPHPAPTGSRNLMNTRPPHAAFPQAPGKALTADGRPDMPHGVLYKQQPWGPTRLASCVTMQVV